jgi:hypothetical protein
MTINRPISALPISYSKAGPTGTGTKYPVDYDEEFNYISRPDLYSV